MYASKRGSEIWQALDVKGAAKSEVRSPMACAEALIEGHPSMHGLTMGQSWWVLGPNLERHAQVIYTALARMAATAGEPDQALQAARDALAGGHAVKLRSFVPALRAFCAAGDFGKAFEVGVSLTAAAPQTTCCFCSPACRHAPWLSPSCCVITCSLRLAARTSVL